MPFNVVKVMPANERGTHWFLVNFVLSEAGKSNDGCEYNQDGIFHNVIEELSILLSLVIGHGSVVICHWSLFVLGLWSFVICHRSLQHTPLDLRHFFFKLMFPARPEAQGNQVAPGGLHRLQPLPDRRRR